MPKINLCVGKLALLGFAYVSACVKGQTPKCANVMRLILFFKMCVGKILKTFCSIGCRQTALLDVALQGNCLLSFCRPRIY